MLQTASHESTQVQACCAIHVRTSAAVAGGCCAAHLNLLQHSLEVAASPLQSLHLNNCFKELLVKPSDLQVAKKSVSTAGQICSPCLSTP